MVENQMVLTGSSVQLVPTEEAHIDELFDAASDPRIWEFTNIKIYSKSDMEQYVKDGVRTEGTLPFTIIDRQTKRMVGATRLYDIAIQHRSLEIGSTWLSPTVWRTSINTETKFLLLEYCFETLGMNRVQFKTDSRNLRSQRAIERLGATKEGILRSHMILPDGYVRDSVYYSIINKEWDVVKKRLEERMLNYRERPTSV